MAGDKELNLRIAPATRELGGDEVFAGFVSQGNSVFAAAVNIRRLRPAVHVDGVAPIHSSEESLAFAQIHFCYGPIKGALGGG